jgi:hypothetical protein
MVGAATSGASARSSRDKEDPCGPALAGAPGISRTGWDGRGELRVRADPTPVITIEESIATLREMIAEVESGSTMIVAPIVGQFD